jgi:hypothetical protein
MIILHLHHLPLVGGSSGAISGEAFEKLASETNRQIVILPLTTLEAGQEGIVVNMPIVEEEEPVDQCYQREMVITLRFEMDTENR